VEEPPSTASSGEEAADACERSLSRDPPQDSFQSSSSEEEELIQNVIRSFGKPVHLLAQKADPSDAKVDESDNTDPHADGSADSDEQAPHAEEVESLQLAVAAEKENIAAFEQKLKVLEQDEPQNTAVSDSPKPAPEKTAVEKPTNAGLEQLLNRWKGVVNDLWPELSEEDAEDLEELHQLLEETEQMAKNGVTARCELCEDGMKPVLVTAPHCVYLLRDGQKPHVVEEYTAAIARAITRHLSGSSLMWTGSEQRATELLWCLSRRRGSSPGQALDPRNRDPNYLSTQELDGNPWYQQMLKTAKQWRELKGAEVSLLHLDVHGCKDPPDTPSHLTVGLGAMRIQAERTGSDKELERVEVFGKALETELGPVLAELKLQPRAKLVRVVIPSTQTLQSHTRFAGAWKPADHRLTQTQQAVSFAGFQHAAQLEMSKTLRRALLQNQIGITRFSNALRAAWVKSKRM